jgi:hypothetical protein
MERYEIYGVISDGHYERPLCMKEYKYWMNHVLPFGWMIIAKPLVVKEGKDEMCLSFK